MASVDIGANSYFVYADIETATIYLAADPNAATFTAATETQQAQWLVSATRILDRQGWAGEKTDGTDQANAWPRTNTGIDGVDEDTIPQAIIDACSELASSIANGTDWANQQSTEQTQKRIKAGSVEVENFRGAGGRPLPLPLPVWSLIGPYLGSSDGAGTIAGSWSAGTCHSDPIGEGFLFGSPF